VRGQGAIDLRFYPPKDPPK